jgi:hypothetical protein
MATGIMYLEVEVEHVYTEQDDRGPPAQDEQSLEGPVVRSGSVTVIGARAEEEVLGRRMSAAVTGRSSVGRVVWHRAPAKIRISIYYATISQ